MYFISFLLKNLLQRRTRSLLTILGVAVAVATIVTLRGVAHGFEHSFQENLETRGVDLVVTGSVINQLSSDLDENLGKRIKALENVSQVDPGLVELVAMEREGSAEPLSVLINAWPPGSRQMRDLELLEGRFYEAGDGNVVLLGSTLAQNLNKKTGDLLKVQEENFTIVGIYRSFTVFENGGAIAPLSVMQKLMRREGRVTGFSVVVQRLNEAGPSTEGKSDKEHVHQVKQAIEALRTPEGESYRISVQPVRDYIANSLPVKLAHGMAWVTSMIALLIGTIGVLNTMMMSVMERTKEIGILRAIGWRARRVMTMILGEALLLSIVAAVLGTLIAVVGIQVLARLPQSSGFVSGEIVPIVLVEGLVMTLVVALVGGCYPAWRASRWMPTEALRHE